MRSTYRKLLVGLVIAIGIANGNSAIAATNIDIYEIANNRMYINQRVKNIMPIGIREIKGIASNDIDSPISIIA